MLIYDLIFYFVLFLATSGLTFCIYRYANALRLIAIEDERSSHQGIVATGGGLAIAASFLFVMGLGFYQQRFPVAFFKALLGGGLLLAVIGFWDDIKPLPIRFRMGWQCVAAFWAIYWLGEFPPILMGGWQLYLGHLASVVTFLAILWFINLYNFMDGIDGLAGTQAVTTAVSMAVIAIVNQQPNQVWLLTALAVMVAGFLVWNGSRARIIIMGDVGAGFLGYVFAVIFLHNSQQSSSLFWAFIILFAIF
jgi:UDP-N-acetylmuramyl pentapeptide phosphotransferase/UDP-N-acetylglucosamine-1-phosphate transferase